ncbi:hypothetical protein [Actinoplanes derwentensis]|uniref:Uncharacterized protein n=1 Tax=Actinoplanes derwentensis TaxID=113562 RepID=A0A1H2BDQ7_9ACTN|nr:hypothetical protein [Actinoplanes derwentensis]GID88640.1 hypothetical protein Ade03nite_75640 [Actinoplanes derwentensis]SDT56019.1 hypothetical protein SAMN04489716_4516 [Actinoplanes derwentensis]
MTQPLEAQISAAGSDLSASVGQARENAATVATHLDSLTAAVHLAVAQTRNAGWFALPFAGPLGPGGAYLYGHKVQSTMDRLRESVHEILDFVETVLDGAIPVFSLIDRAFGWLNVVQAPVSAMSDTAGQYVINLNNWSGSARKAYDQRVPIQVKNIDGLSQAGGEMASWLGELVAVNASYIWMLVKPLFDIGGAILAAVAEAATVVGAFHALGKCAELIEIAVQSMWEQIDAALAQLTALINKMLEAKKITGSLGDSWPDMVTFE